ncbi:50 kDa gamma-zein-like [Phragmites australis]|uniref:50 kDa gamma-zein-like n=1 Tax=Phragmites australis TaxID=29695 RepID=UPI002D775B90|nr:50 kDa gamma-zein-like [Phragmites australis]
MKKMLVVLALLALAASSGSATTNNCGCGKQSHEQQQQQQQQWHPWWQQQQQWHPWEQQQQWHPWQQQQQWHGQQWQGHEQQTAQGGYGDYYGTSLNLSQCGEFLRQQCNPVAMPFLQSRPLPPSSCQVLRKLCCRQLRKVEPQYRHQAIYGMVQSIMQQQQQGGVNGCQQGAQGQTSMMVAAQMAQQLPAMCGLQSQPSYDAAPYGMAGGGFYQPSYGASPYGMAGGGLLF